MFLTISTTIVIIIVVTLYITYNVNVPKPKPFSRIINQDPTTISRNGEERVACKTEFCNNENPTNTHCKSPSNKQTIWDIFQTTTETYPNNKFFGSRPIVDTIYEEKIIQGKKKNWCFEQLGSYNWKSYKECFEICSNVGRGILQSGLKQNDYITMYCDTCEEWMTVALGCWSQSITVSTVYANIGKRGIINAIRQVEPKALFVGKTNIAELKDIIQECPSIQMVYFREDNYSSEQIISILNDKKIYSVSELQQLGKEYHDIPLNKAQPDDVALIMFTSGTTGTPKGVMIQQKAISSTEQVSHHYFELTQDDVVLAALPLAHIIEVVIEIAVMNVGAKLGYGSPRTLLDANVKKCKGDLTELKPTVMIAVPAILDKIRKGILSKLRESYMIIRFIFWLSMKIKKAGWNVQNRFIVSKINHLLDITIFNSVAKMTGGRISRILSGGAPLSSTTRLFINCCLNCHIRNGYGMTESCGMSCLQQPKDMNIYSVGPPVCIASIKLVDKPKLGYTSNTPNPSGEVCIKGVSLFKGYFKNPELTNEALDDEGWLHTGDVGEWLKDGTLKIIDRCKNLAKLAHGEYIAPEALESVYSRSSFVECIYVHVDPTKAYPIALIVPNKTRVEQWAKRTLSKEEYVNICHSEKLHNAVLKSLLKDAKGAELKSVETITKFILCTEEWTTTNGLLTTTNKIIRHNLAKYYFKQIEDLFKENNND
ncbi:AMP-dependent synthetase/ligase domain-containing protein [Entamoeba marina]